jgi:hypothetical protein
MPTRSVVDGVGLVSNARIPIFSCQADRRDSLLLGAALDLALLAMKTVEEGSLSADELLRMHQCTEAIRFLSAAGLIPTKQPEEAGFLQTGPSYSSRLGGGVGKRQ